MRQLGRNDAAIIQYQKALDIEPSNPHILVKTAKACIADGKDSDAVNVLKRAVETNPNYPTPYQLLSAIYLKMKDYDNAGFYAKESISINPFYPQSHKILAEVFLLKGLKDESEIEFHDSLRLEQK